MCLGESIISADGLPVLDPVTKQKPLHLSRDFGALCLEMDGFAQVFPEHKVPIKKPRVNIYFVSKL